ncbi:MAG: citramalate synthase [Candidatus Omnitrophica bacterium]|nr:citramalate synthase [Candidatus Omnitrophota bacterium]
MIYLYDTTLRDGAQGEGVSLSLKDKLLIAERLDKFGVHFIEGGWPGSNPKDMAFFKEIQNAGFKQAKIVAFGSTRRADKKVQEDSNVKSLIESGTKVVTIFGKSWDFQVTEVFKTTLEENLRMIRETVSYLKEKGLEVIYDAEHFFDGYKENPEYALKTLQEAAASGAANITLCDTNGGSLPTEIREAIRGVKKVVKVPLGIHCHNDSNLAVANSVAAVEEGALLVQGTVNGYGERCGNANLTSIIPILQLKMKKRCLPDEKLKELTEVSHYVAEICNMSMELNQPFTGRSAFAHKGGVHIDAMQKNVKTYEHMDPELIGNRRRFLTSELGGRTNLLVKARELNIDLRKDSPETKRILEKVQKLENEGYQFEAAEASFLLLVLRELGREKKFFEVERAMVPNEKIGDRSSVAKAIVKITVKTNGKKKAVQAKEDKGDGPVDALYKALKKALQKFYPVINQIHLTDYKVRVVDSKAGTAAKVRVFVTFQDEKESWTTVGVNKNIIEASWQALIEAIEYKLVRE